MPPSKPHATLLYVAALYASISHTQPSFGPAAPTVSTSAKTANFSIGPERFSATGVRVTRPGFTAVMTWRSVAPNPMPDFGAGESVQVGEVELANGKEGMR